MKIPLFLLFNIILECKGRSSLALGEQSPQNLGPRRFENAPFRTGGNWEQELGEMFLLFLQPFEHRCGKTCGENWFSAQKPAWLQ